MKRKQNQKLNARADQASWKGIRQDVGGPGASRHARTRTRDRTTRLVACAALLALIVGGVGTGIWYLDRGSEPEGSGIKANPIEEIVLLTDGVLSDEWINRRLGIPAEAGLMDVDIQGIKERLEADGQVETAAIARRFPTTLVVSLTERAPVARVVTRAEGARAEVFLVAVDGYVYQGFGYESSLLESLPYLDGLRLVRRGSGFAPIPRLDDVVSLFSVARRTAPHLCREWKIVVLDRRPFIVVRTPEVGEIIFESGGFRQQLARLDYILDFYRRSPDGFPARIDLSFENQAAVELAVGQTVSNPKPKTPRN